MTLILFLVISAIVLSVAYRVMSVKLRAWLELRADAGTPAHTMRDGLDFEPLSWKSLLPQHFSAIAAAGPIVGPILAATLFGWGPAWAWILLGSIFIGGIHDFMALIASVRHQARSVAEVVRQYMNDRAYRLFLIFIWIALVYVIIAFADVTAGAFVQAGSTAEATAPGPAVATSSIIYLLLAVAMGLVMRRTGFGAGKAKAIFLPLVFLAIIIGPSLPFDLGRIFPGMPTQKLWNYLLLGYCFLASIAPVWLLLQPRGELGGYFLYFIMIFGVVGIVVGGLTGALAINAPALSGAAWFSATANPLVPGATLPALFPLLFITVACGACSGFHSIVASGTTSKQLASESDAPAVAYGSMLLEAFFACLSLATVMILAVPKGNPAGPGARPDAIYSGGIAQFMHHATFGILPVTAAYQFALLCFTTFVFDTLDACTRLARYVLIELTGWRGRRGVALATFFSLLMPLGIVSLPAAVIDGKTMPIWQVFWGLFGSSNQLLAALALLGITVWLYRTGRRYGLTLFGTVFMSTMTIWSLGITALKYPARLAKGPVAALLHIEFLVAVVLIGLALWLMGEAILTWKKLKTQSAVTD